MHAGAEENYLCSFHSRSRCVITAIWPQWNYAGGQVKTSEPVASLPTVKAGLRAVPAKLYFVSLHSRAWGHKRAHTQVNSSREEEHLVAFSCCSPRGNTQIPSAWHCWSESPLRNRYGGIYSDREQTPFLRGQWQQQSEGEVLLNV